jgi:DNA polymerase III sliding clamp (beta) subunit (PCNA family)
MITSDFKKFLGILRLAELGMGDPPVTFSPSPLELHYEGMHIGGIARAQADVEVSGLLVPVSVDAKRLRGVLTLLHDDANLAVTFGKSVVTFSGPGRRLKLTTGLASEVQRPVKEKPKATAVVDTAELLRAVKFLLPMTTKNISAAPVLTGLHLRSEEDRLVIEATDSARAGRADVASKNKKDVDVVVPAVDLEAALSVVGEKAIVRVIGNTVEVADRNNYIRMSTLMGNFPKLDDLPTKGKRRAQLSPVVVDDVSKAAKVLETAYDIRVKAAGGRVRLSVSSDETGKVDFAAGKSDHDLDLHFDVDLFSMSKELPDPITLIQTKSTAIFRGENGWLYWLPPIIR